MPKEHKYIHTFSIYIKSSGPAQTLTTSTDTEEMASGFLTIQVKPEPAELDEIDSEALWACDTCDGTFSDFRSLQLHVSGNGNLCKGADAPSPSPVTASPAKKIPRLKMYPKQPVPKNTALRFVCPYCRESTERRDRGAHVMTHAETIAKGTPFLCQYCPASFKTGRERISHEHLHILPPFICRKCTERFHKRSELASHHVFCEARQHFTREGSCIFCRDLVHVPEQQLEHYQGHVHQGTDFIPKACHASNCDRTFRHRSELLEHLRSAHVGEPPYPCKTCPGKFWSPADLKLHKDRIHDRPNKCPKCDKRFGHVHELQEHELTHK
jgi:hypothetical protein